MRLIKLLPFSSLGKHNSKAFPKTPSLVILRWTMIAIAAGWGLFLPYSSFAQEGQFAQNKVDQTRRSNLRVDPTTLGLNLQIPLGSYPGRGEVNHPISLNYSSKVWGEVELPETGQYLPNMPKARYAVNSVAGWTSSLGVPVIQFTGREQLFNSYGSPCAGCSSTVYYFITRIHVHMPSGSTHELRKSDIAVESNGASPIAAFIGTFSAVDGSRLRYDTTTNTLYLPDGSSYVLGDPEGNLPAASAPVTKYIDRNGNTLTYSPSTKKWTDTLQRVIGLPVPVVPAQSDDIWTTTPNGQAVADVVYVLKGLNGSPLNYTLRWKQLENALTDPSQPLHYTGSHTRTQHPAPVSGPYLFGSEIVKFAADGQLFNPVVLSEVILPTGESYKFSYNAWGEIDKVVHPTGGYERFIYQFVSSISRYGKEINRGVVERRVSAKGDGTDEAVWNYAASYAGANYAPPFKVSVTEPNGTRTERLIYTNQDPMTVQCGFDNALAGMAYEERVYSASNQPLRRILTEWTVSLPTSGGWATARRNPRVTKQVEIVLDTAPGTNALSKTTTYEYDADLNVKFLSQYNYAGVNQTTAQTGSIENIPSGTLMRKDETVYLVNDPTIIDSIKDEYRNRNLIGLSTVTRIWNSTNEKVAETLISYDDPEYPLISFGQIEGWNDPGTIRRGNPTTAKRWQAGTTYLTTHAQFDSYGNGRKTWDAKGNMSEIEYSTAFAYAYPTQTMTPSIPSIGTLTTSTDYDRESGLTLSTTDANGQVTHYQYIDPLNRQTAIIPPAGGARTDIFYDDTPSGAISRLSVRTQTDLGGGRVQTSYQYFDGLGRPSRTFINEDNNGTTTWIVTDTLYDQMGQVQQQSSPYRLTSVGGATNTPAGISTITNYDALGRIIKITTPDGAEAFSSYVGNVVTVTDQAGKMKSSVSDALGRPEKVIEYPAGEQPYETFYKYDGLSNLSMVTQGVQKRYFKYDSLGRLLRAKNPEQNAQDSLNLYDALTGNAQWSVGYTYDDNGNLETTTDARSITTTYSYDVLNRVKTSSYSDNTPVVTYIYDVGGLPDSKAKGRLVSSSSSVSSTSYDKYDAQGQIRQSTQTTDGHTYVMYYEYDLAGNMTSQTYPSGRKVTTNYDDSGRIKSVVGPNNLPYADSFGYAASGAMEAMRQGNGLWQHSVFNARLQPMEIGLGTAANNSDRLKLVYDYGTTNNNGNVRRQIITVPGASGFVATQHYKYDELNRLTGAQEISGDTSTWQDAGAIWQQTFGYDRYANRTSQAASNISGFAPAPAIVTGTNRIDTTSGLFAYDDAGNLTKEPVHSGASAPQNSYGYDAENHLIQATQGEVALGNYVYDGDGRRVKKLAGGITTIFVYNIIGQLVAEYDNSPSRPATTQTSYLMADNLGSTRAMTNAASQITARYDYLPFGEEIGESVGGRGNLAEYSANYQPRQRYTGKERDLETGLDYFHARYFSSNQGRFTSVDPLQASGNTAEPQTWNRYAYVDNNPLKYVDTDGLIKTNPDTGMILFDPRSMGSLDYEIYQDSTMSATIILTTQWKVGSIYTDKNNKIEAYSVFGTDFKGGDARFATNCFGLTFANGEVWIKFSSVQTILDDEYTEVKAKSGMTPEVGDVAIYKDEKGIAHSATVTAVDDKGNVTEVTGINGVDSRATSTAPDKQQFNPVGKVKPPRYYRENNSKDPKKVEQRKRRVAVSKGYRKPLVIDIDDPPERSGPGKKG